MAPSNGTPRRTPPGGIVTQRMQAAAIRALDAHRRARFVAESVSEELDETTAPHGIPVTELHDEDSLVVVVKDALAAHGK